MRDLQAHVDKLTEILDEVSPCNENCDLAAVQAWVDPADRQRVAELRSRRSEVIDAARVYFEANDDGHVCGGKSGERCPACVLGRALADLDRSVTVSSKKAP